MRTVINTTHCPQHAEQTCWMAVTLISNFFFFYFLPRELDGGQKLHIVTASSAGPLYSEPVTEIGSR